MFSVIILTAKSYEIQMNNAYVCTRMSPYYEQWLSFS